MEFKRVSKPTARKLYNNGITIKLLPCRVSVSAITGESNWVKPVEISLITSTHDANHFDRSVREFEYYNCSALLGYYAHYYVRVEDLEAIKLCNLMC